VASPLCSRCGLVFKSREGEDHLCGRCLDRPGAFTRARAAGIYDNALKVAIHALKFKNQVNLAIPLGALLFETFRHYWTAGDIDVVAPVPLHRHRFRQRGFNQAYLLVRRWALPAETVVIRDLLVRTRATAPQTGLDRQQRRINIKNAFSVNRRGQSAGKRVLLVDDVLTTGATAEACADALIRDGARTGGCVDAWPGRCRILHVSIETASFGPVPISALEPRSQILDAVLQVCLRFETRSRLDLEPKAPSLERHHNAIFR
jgi:ComF family protein